VPRIFVPLEHALALWVRNGFALAPAEDDEVLGPVLLAGVLPEADPVALADHLWFGAGESPVEPFLQQDDVIVAVVHAVARRVFAVDQEAGDLLLNQLGELADAEIDIVLICGRDAAEKTCRPRALALGVELVNGREVHVCELLLLVLSGDGHHTVRVTVKLPMTDDAVQFGG
jgi:hypothetical protein